MSEDTEIAKPKKNTLLKWALRILPIIILVIGYFIGNHYLKQFLQEKGISYQYLSIGSNKIKAEGLIWQQSDSSSLKLDTLEISWTWKTLLSGKEDENFTERLLRSVHNIDISNFSFYQASQSDSLNVFVLSARLAGLNTATNYHIDSVVLNQVSIYQNNLGELTTSENRSSTDLKSILDSLVDISINSLSISQSDIEYISNSDRYSVKDLRLGLKNISTLDPLSLKMDTLYLLYADTLEISAGLDKALIDKNLVAWINSLNLNLDGLNTTISADYSLDNQLQLNAKITPTYLSLAWLKIFYPKVKKHINSSLSPDTPILISAIIHLTKSSIKVEDFHLSILSTHINGFGHHDWSGDFGRFSWNLTELNSNKRDLYQILPVHYSSEQIKWPEQIKLSVNYSGENRYWDVKLDLQSSSGDIKLLSELDMNSMDFPFQNLEVQVQNLFPDQLLTKVKTEINDLSFTLNGNAESMNNLNAIAEIENFTFKNERYSNIRTHIKRNNGLDSLYLEISEPWLALDLATQLELSDTSSVTFISNMNLKPDRLGLDSLFNKGFMELSGSIGWSGSDFYDGSILLDSINIIYKDSSNFSITDLDWLFSLKNDLNFTRLELKEGQYTELTWRTLPEEFDLVSINNAIETLDLFFWTKEENLVFDLSDSYSMNLDLDTLMIKKENQIWSAEIDIPYLSVSDLIFEDISYLLDESRSGGELSISGIEGFPFTLDDLKIEHDMFPDSTLHLNIKGYADESQIPFNIPMIAKISDTGIFTGIDRDQIIEISDFSFRTTEASGLRLNSDYRPEYLSLGITENDSSEHHALIQAQINLQENNHQGALEWEDLDIGKITGKFLDIGGSQINAITSSKLIFDTQDLKNLKGEIFIENSSFYHSELGAGIKMLDNAIRIENGTVSLNDLILLNEDQDSLVLTGSLKFKDSIHYSTDLRSESFKLINSTPMSSDLSGLLEFKSDLQLEGNLNSLKIEGGIDLLPTSSVYYLQQSSLKVFDPNEIIVFEDFKDTVKTIIESPPRPFVVEWDVEVKIDDTDIEVLFYEETQEFIRVNLNGDIQLTNNPRSPLPYVFGSVYSNNGRAFYSPGGVPDLNLLIEALSVNWNGELNDPLISLSAYEIIRINASQLSSQFANRGLEDFYIKVVVPENTIDALDISFDVDAEDLEISQYISSFPEDTRSIYAFNLLTFGKFHLTDVSASSYTLVANKMNELSHRNIKNADLYFAGETRRSDKDGRLIEDLNYNLSKNFVSDRLLFTINGTIQTAKSNEFQGIQSHWIDDIQIDYELQKEPDLSIRGARKNNYMGVVDGEIIETTLGLHLSHSFRKLFSRKK